MFVDVATNALAIIATADNSGVNNRELLIKKNIINVTPMYQAVAQDQSNDWEVYKYPVMTRVSIEFTDHKKFDFECQDVANQPTWNLGTLAALNIAIADILAHL
jgi:hypothetical protein